MAQEVEVKIKVNTSQAVTGVNKLEKGLKDVSSQAEETTESVSKMARAEAIINTVGDAVGKLNPAFGAAIKSANGLLVKFWQLVANPWGAVAALIVGVMKFLYEAFENSVAGGKELKAVFAAVSAIGTQVKDAIFGLARALINVTTAAYKFINLDFKGAAESMKAANKEATESYKQLGKAVDGTTSRIEYNLTKQQQANDKARKVQAVVQSETNKLLVKSREILTDETASIKDKKKALEDVTKAEIASSKEKVRIAKEDKRILEDRAKNLGGEAEKKMKGEIREATIALNEAETENAMTGIKLNKQRKMLGRQETSDAKEAADAQKEILKAKTEAENEALKVKEQKQKESFDLEKASVEEQLKSNKISIDEKRNIVLEDNKLSTKDRQKFLLDLQQEEILAEENHNKAIADINKRYDDEKANRLADTAVKKEQLDYERKVLEIETIAQTELEKQTLIEKLDAEHKIRLGIATKTDSEKKIADAKTEADALKLIEEQKTAVKRKALDDLQGIFGTETAMGKAVLLAKQALAIQELVLSVKSTIQAAKDAATKSTLKAAEAGVDIASGAAKSAGAAPFPANIPLIIGYAASAFGIYSSIKAALSKVKGASSMSLNAASSPSAMSTPTTLQPSINVVGASKTNQIAETISMQGQQPIKAYVVANDVTTQQGLDRNIVKSATIG